MSAGEEFSPVRVIDCSAPLEFLRFLEPTGELFNSSDWLFRGHTSPTYTLSATIFRPESEELIKSVLGRHSPLDEFRERDHTNGYQILKEVQMLFRFAEASDSAGVVLPGPTMITMTDLKVYESQLIEDLRDQLNYARRGIDPLLRGQPWPDPDHYQLMAIARHAGIPTRLLDWSRSAYVAAYFACEVAARGTATPGESVHVWALDSLRLCSPISIDRKETKLVSDVKVLKEGNYNMIAQQGMFTTTVTPLRGWSGDAETKPLEQRVTEQVRRAEIDTRRQLAGTLLRISLPVEHAPTVLKFLRNHGISRSTMFPGYDAIVQDFREENVTETAPRLVDSEK